MKLIRLDENSIERNIKEVLSFEVGTKFYMDPKFRTSFEALIPKDKVFRFSPIAKSHPDFEKYGENCFVVLENHKTYFLG